MQFPCNSLSLTIAARRVEQIYDRIFAPIGMTAGQYHLLAMISSVGPVSKEALGRALIMDAGDLNRGLKPLIEAELVALSSTGRASARVLSITDSGKNMMRRAETRFAVAQTMFDKAIGGRAASSMRDLLHDVINANYDVGHGTMKENDLEPR